MFPYSDGSPPYEAAVAACLIVAFSVIGLTPARHRFNSLTHRIASGLRRTGMFSANISLSAEVHRMDLLRIAIGLMATLHYLPELRSAIAIGATGNALWFGATTALCACVTVGFATPLASVALLLSLNILVVNYTLNISIGSLAIAMCLIPMAIAPAGHTLSIDAMLLRRKTPVTMLYAVWGAPTVDRIQIGRFLALLAFAAINIYSALNHLQAQTWLDGLTVATILLFPVIDPKYHEVAATIYSHAPALYVAISKFTTWGMIAWQLFMVPLALWSRWTRLIVIVWGIIFFVFSAHVLAIKTLGTYEYVLFAIVFWSRSFIDNAGRHGLMIFFDDRCNLCDRTVKALSALDLFHRLEFRPLSSNIEAARQHGVSEDEALTDLVGVTPSGRIFRGYGLYQAIAARVLLTLPLWPILFLGRAVLIGPIVYRFIADRRRRLFGVCHLGTHKPRMEWTSQVTRSCSALANAMILSFVILLIGYALRLPLVGDAAPALASASKSAIGRAPLAFGFGEIDVFNEGDLQLYRKFSATSFVTPNGETGTRSFPVSEVMNSLLTQDLRAASASSLYCSLDFGKRFADFVAQGLTENDAARGWSVKAIFSVATHPSRDEMLSYKYVPLTWERVCTTIDSIGAKTPKKVEFAPETMSRYASLIGESLSSQQTVFALRFPCGAEKAAIAQWYDKAPGVRSGDELASMRKMFFSTNPLECLSSFREILPKAQNPSSSGLTLNGESCETALSSARGYLDILSGEPSATEKFAAAFSAAANKDRDACLAAVGEIRQAYMDEIFAKPQSKPAASPQSLAHTL